MVFSKEQVPVCNLGWGKTNETFKYLVDFLPVGFLDWGIQHMSDIKYLVDFYPLWAFGLGHTTQVRHPNIWFIALCGLLDWDIQCRSNIQIFG